ncbi:MAG: carbohydrate kinase family protein, partial [Candidatus Bathyarchaeota archaeon]
MRPRFMADLLDCLKQIKPKEFKVVVMPDFFLDRLLTYNGDGKKFAKDLAEVAGRKGGSIHGIRQAELRGGNATNTAAALAKLGARVSPIISTSSFGLHLLKFYLEPLGVDLSHIKTQGSMALTTAFELLHEGERVNVMMSTLGSLPDFGLDSLTRNDFKVLQQADYICVFHWACTRRFGTELAEGVFRYVKEEGRGKTYLDTSDPTPNLEAVPNLINRVLSGKHIDVLSVSENEALMYASQLSEEINLLRRKLKPEELAMECARTLAKNLSARIDLHTTTFSGSFTPKKEVVVPAFKVQVLRSTGAGDSWNAGNIWGDALHIPDACRLTLANAVAAHYTSDP